MCAQEWLRNLSILEKNWWVWLSYIIYYNVYMTRTIIKESGKVHTPCFLYYYNFCLCKIYQISLVLFYTRFWESGCKGMTFFSTDQIFFEIFSKNNSFSHFSLIQIKESKKQNRQLMLKTSIAYPKNEKSLFISRISLANAPFLPV